MTYVSTEAVAGDKATSAGSVPALELVDVEVRYPGTYALRGINLIVREGEFLALLGPSGSGKSTILRSIAGFLPLDAGRVLIDGRDVTALEPRRRRLGIVFQNYALFPHLTVLENVQYGLRMDRMPKRHRRQRALEMLALVDLPDHGDRMPGQLSGGQQQRVALARALAFDPPILMLDEPLGALDREMRLRMGEELRSLHRQVKKTFIYVTHDREEALSLSTHVAILRDGTLEANSTPEELYRDPPSGFVGSFFGGHNILPVSLDGARISRDQVVGIKMHGVEIDLASPATAVDDPVLVVPPDAVGVTPEPGTGRVPVRVHDSLFLGTHVQLSVELVDQPGIVLNATLDTASTELPKPGSQMYLILDTSRCRLVPR